MNWALFWTLLVAFVVVMAISYVIRARRGNGHVTDTRDAPWEDNDDD